jgi:hypothetical protein
MGDRIEGAGSVEPGTMVCGRVVAHHPWGVDLALEVAGDEVATIDIRFVSDDPADMNVDRFPPIGTRLRAKVHGRTPSGQLRVTIRASDLGPG